MKIQLQFNENSHRHSRSRLLTHRSGGVTCMINPRWRANRAKNYKTLYREINVFRDLKRVVTRNRFESTFFGKN